MIELTQIMRQRDDLAFTQLLNRVRTASHTEEDIQCIQSRKITSGVENYPSEALHIFAENAPVCKYNILIMVTQRYNTQTQIEIHKHK